MTNWSELERLPADMLVRRTSRVVFAVRADLEAGLASAGYGPDSQGGLRESDLAGRGPLGEAVVGAERFVVRRFAHGGLLRWLTGRRFWNPLRPFRELLLARRLAELGLRVPEVVAASAKRTATGAWELDLVSRRVEDSLDLGTVLARGARGALSTRSELQCARALGELVARMHAVGFLHMDLTPRNVLVEVDSLAGREPRLWVVDLDGSRFVPRLSQEQRVANVARLWRHVARMQREGLAPRSARLCAGFLASYEPRRGERRALASGLAEFHRRTRGWHAAGDVLEKGVGARRSQPRP